MPPPTEARLRDYRRRYQELARKVAEIGFISAGSITRRHTKCGTPGCHCRADPPQMHGPYYQWTTKVDGKTITRRLSERQAQLYTEWIGNDRELRALITQMRQIATKATDLILKEADQQHPKV